MWLPDIPFRQWIAAFAIAVAVAVIPGLWSAAGLAALAVVVLVLASPRVAVYLLALSVPLGSLLEVGADSTLTVSPTEVLAGLLALSWAAHALARRRFVIPLTPLLVPLLALIAAVAVSVYQAKVPALTLKESVKWIELALVYLFVVAEMGTGRQMRALLWFLFAAASIEAMIGLVQFALGIGPKAFEIGRFMRAYGTFEQPNPFAGYLGMLVPILAAFLLSRPSRRERNAAVIIGVLVAAALAASLSRGAWVGIGIALATMALFWSRRSRLLLAIGAIASAPVAALVFLNLLPAEVTGRLATVLDYFRFIDVRTETATPENWALLERVAHWQAALDMIAAHPLLGVGAGNYPAVYEEFMVPGWTEPLGHAHNYYLNMAAETGIPGLLLYVVLLAVASLSVVRWLVQHPDRRGEAAGHGSAAEAGHGALWRAILLGVLGTLVATSIHNMFDNLFVHGMSVQLGMLLGLAQVAAIRLSPTAHEHRGLQAS